MYEMKWIIFLRTVEQNPLTCHKLEQRLKDTLFNKLPNVLLFTIGFSWDTAGVCTTCYGCMHTKPYHEHNRIFARYGKRLLSCSQHNKGSLTKILKNWLPFSLI